MKKIFIGAVAFLMAACSSADMKLTVKNTLDFDREGEVVEVSWSEVKAKVKGATPANVIVSDANGQVSSQVVYEGNSEPVKLIFAATVLSEDETEYTVSTGVREAYPVQAFGRYVPERLDDYAWENNLVAYRLYGPALKDPLTPGIDVWAKCTEKMIIDEWYAKGDYHHNYGDGMDAYKVAKTLGGGGCAPMLDYKLWLSGNYETQQNLDNGPLRTSVKLTYAPFTAGEHTVALEKVISLDANTYFSKMTNVYTGDFESVPVAAGMIMHVVKDKTMEPRYVTLTEEVSDSKQPEVDGDISLAIIMPDAKFAAEVDDHLVIVGDAANGRELVYYSGTGWSGAAVKNADIWKDIVVRELAKIDNPLIVE